MLGVITVYPFVWMLCSSFKKNSEIMALEQHLLPQEFILDNYVNGWKGFAKISFATFFILCADPTEVPPNFKTFIFLLYLIYVKLFSFQLRCKGTQKNYSRMSLRLAFSHFTTRAG